MIIPLITRGTRKYRFAAKGYRLKEAAPILPIITSFSLNSFPDTIDPGFIRFDYNVSDADGTVDKLELLREDDGAGGFNVVKTETAGAPFSTGVIIDDPIPAGSFEYRLRITDDDAQVVTGAIESGGPYVVTAASVIVTFDSGVPKVFADNEDIPGFTAVMKARKFNSAVIEQTAGDKGKIASSVGADTGYFIGKIDQLAKGTWEMTADVNAIAVGGQMDIFFNDGEYSGNAGGEPVEYRFGIVLFSSGSVRARYRNTSGTMTDIGGGDLTTYSIGVDGEIEIKLGETATHFTMSWNGVTASIVKGSVKARTTLKLVAGECCNGTTVTVEMDNFAGID